MRRALLAIAVAVSLATCGGEGTEPAKFDRKFLIGIWEVIPDSTWSCWSGKPYLWFQVTQQDEDRQAPATALAVISTWSRDREKVAEGNLITGQFNTYAKTADFLFWSRPGELFAELRGDVDGTVIRGRLTSPKGMASESMECDSKSTATRL